VVVGAGPAGLYQLHRLRELGLTYRVFEAGSGIGGTWNWKEARESAAGLLGAIPERNALDATPEERQAAFEGAWGPATSTRTSVAAAL